MTRHKKIAVIAAVALVAAGAVVLWLSRHEIAHHFTLVRAGRMVDEGIVTEADLIGRFAIPAENFDQISSSPQWSAVPRDFCVFRNVPLQIDGMLGLWGASNAKAGFVLPEQALDVGIKGKFETLYLIFPIWVVAHDRRGLFL